MLRSKNQVTFQAIVRPCAHECALLTASRMRVQVWLLSALAAASIGGAWCVTTPSAPTPPDPLVQALELEASNTTAVLWGLKEPAAKAADRPRSP
jgi:hypothetical protein